MHLAGGFEAYSYVKNTNLYVDIFGLKQSVYVLRKKGKIVYVGITNDPKTRKGSHKNKKKGKFDEMIVIAEYDSGNNADDRVNARNLEGSALDQANGSLAENANRIDRQHYHSYDPDNLAPGRTYIEDVDLSDLANNGTVIN